MTYFDDTCHRFFYVFWFVEFTFFLKKLLQFQNISVSLPSIILFLLHIMRKQFISFALLLFSLTAGAQQAMQVWHNGKYMLIPITEVDSVRFVTLVTDIYLSPEAIELKEGETKQLTATVYPMDADDKAVTWESIIPGVASVDANGLVTAVSAGTSVITATATDGSGVKAECQVTVTKAGGDTAFLTCPDDHHPHAIDLGLPSGTKWCCCNVGASTPEGYGGYYAWGETSEKSVYNGATYAYGYSDSDGYYHWTNIGSDIAGTSYDVAHVRMGAPWRMPSTAQQQELFNNCSHQWTQQNGVNGTLVTGRNGGQIFLPAAGYRSGGELNYARAYGFYWSSALSYDVSSAYSLGFYSGSWNWFDGYRSLGRSVRAVCP